MTNITPMIAKPKGRRYRVLHIITRLIRGGADNSTLHCINSLDHDRFEADLIVGRDSDAPQVQDATEIVSVTKLDSLVREIRPVRDLAALLAIYRIIKRNGYDIVHTHTAKAGFVGRLAAHLAGTPYVIHGLHGTTFPPTLPWISRKFYITLERMAGPWADRVVSVSQDLIDLYLAHGIGQPHQYSIIRSGIRLRPFKEARALSDGQLDQLRQSLGVRPHDVVIGNVGRLERRKGFHYYIEAARLIAPNHPNAKFLVVGEGDERPRLERRVKRAGLQEQVIFTGFRKDIARVMATFDIFAFTSLWEGLPQVMVQSAALGKPIVTFPVEGAKEIVDHGKSGYIVPSRDVVALAARLDELCASPTLCQQMGKQILDSLSLEQWSLDEVSGHIAALYEEALSRLQ